MTNYTTKLFTKNMSVFSKVSSSLQEVFCKKGVPKTLQNSQENTCARVSFLIKLQALDCNFIKKETLANVFSVNFAKTCNFIEIEILALVFFCEHCEIFKNSFFTEHLRKTTSDFSEYYGLYDLKTRRATSTSVHENLYITHAQNQGKPFWKVLLHGTDVKR